VARERLADSTSGAGLPGGAGGAECGLHRQAGTVTAPMARTANTERNTLLFTASPPFVDGHPGTRVSHELAFATRAKASPNLLSRSRIRRRGAWP